MVVATHPAGKKKSPIGVTRAGRRLRTLLHQSAAAGVHRLPMSSNCTCIGVPLSLTLADEDQEQDPDRWCSHSAWGQECWQVVSQWVWNLRLELGHQLQPDPVRTTEFAPAIPSASLTPLPRRTPPLPPAMLPLRWACPGKLVVSRARTLLSSLMGRCAVLLTRNSSP